MRRTAFAPSILCLVILGCSAPELTPDQRMALRQAQTRTYEVPMDTVFRSTVAYLQDNAYQIRQASKDSGLISAFKSKDVSGAEKFWGAFFAGVHAKKGDAYEVSFTFEAIDETNTTTRVNITHGAFNLAGANTDVQAVTDPALYKQVLDALSLEVNRRHLTNQMRQEKTKATTSG